MASNVRTSWRDFKKKYPEFEKNKAFKTDVGPHLDKLAKAVEGFEKSQAQAEAMIKHMQDTQKTLRTAMGAYQLVAKDIADPSLQTGFRVWMHLLQEIGEEIDKLVQATQAVRRPLSDLKART